MSDVSSFLWWHWRKVNSHPTHISFESKSCTINETNENDKNSGDFHLISCCLIDCKRNRIIIPPKIVLYITMNLYCSTARYCPLHVKVWQSNRLQTRRYFGWFLDGSGPSFVAFELWKTTFLSTILKKAHILWSSYLIKANIVWSSISINQNLH